jgi:hypothetical protein
MLTGHFPFEGDDVMDIVRQHIKQQVVPPIEHREEIPQRISDVICKMMKKNPDERYATGGEVAEVLTRALQCKKRAKTQAPRARRSQASRAVTPPAHPQAPESSMKKLLTLGAAAIVVLAVLIGVMLSPGTDSTVDGPKIGDTAVDDPGGTSDRRERMQQVLSGQGDNAVALEEGLAACWPFDAAHGTGTSDHGGDDIATKPLGGPTPVPGVEGAALWFDGAEQRIEADAAALFAGDNVSISLWAMAAGPLQSQTIVQVGQGEVAHRVDSRRGGRDLAVGLNLDSGYIEVLAPLPDAGLADGEWHHISVSFDGAAVSI